MGCVAGSPMTRSISSGRSVMVSHRRDSRVWSVHGTTDPGPPVISGAVGASSCATSALTPALPRMVFASETAPQPTPASAAEAAKRPMVR